MKASAIGSLVGLVLGIILTIGVLWGLGYVPNNDKKFARELQQAKTELQKKINEQSSAVQAAKDAAVATNDGLKKLSESLGDSPDNMVQDKLAEMQSQLTDMQKDIEDKISAACTCCAAKPKPQPVAKKVTKTTAVKQKVTPCKETTKYKECVSTRESRWDQVCKNLNEEETITSRLWEKNVSNKNLKQESNAAIIKIEKPQKPAMCMTPRDFYKTDCVRIECSPTPTTQTKTTTTKTSTQSK